MPGHNALSNLTRNQTGTSFEGGPLFTTGSGEPGSTTPGGKGAIYIRTDGSADACWYMNVGTEASKTWKAISNEA